MPETAFNRFGTKSVVVLDATATDSVQIDFDIGSASLYLLGGDLIARTITDRMIFLARLKDAVAERPAMVISTVGGPTFKARSLLERAAPLTDIAELFSLSRAESTDHPFDR